MNRESAEFIQEDKTISGKKFRLRLAEKASTSQVYTQVKRHPILI